jgi:hypothetical protein
MLIFPFGMRNTPDLFFLGQKDKDGGNALDGVDAITEATTVFRTN